MNEYTYDAILRALFDLRKASIKIVLEALKLIHKVFYIESIA